MSSPQHCLALADEADRLAGIVSYERDRERLRAQASAWRQMAGTLSAPVTAVAVASPIAEAPSLAHDTTRRSAVTGWLKRRRA